MKRIAIHNTFAVVRAIIEQKIPICVVTHVFRIVIKFRNGIVLSLNQNIFRIVQSRQKQHASGIFIVRISVAARWRETYSIGLILQVLWRIIRIVFFHQCELIHEIQFRKSLLDSVHHMSLDLHATSAGDNLFICYTRRSKRCTCIFLSVSLQQADISILNEAMFQIMLIQTFWAKS